MKTRWCPACTSTQFKPLINDFKCYTCGHRFDEPATLTKSRSCGSGVVAPLSYLQQQVRDILNANAEAAANVKRRQKGIYFGKQK